MERGQESCTTQVMINQENGWLYSVNDDGVILQLICRYRGSQVVLCNTIIVTQLHVLLMKQCICMTDTSHKSVASLRSALSKAHLENEELQLVLEGNAMNWRGFV